MRAVVHLQGHSDPEALEDTRRTDENDQQESDSLYTIESDDFSQRTTILGIGEQIDPRLLKYPTKDRVLRRKASGRRSLTRSTSQGTYFRARVPSGKTRDIALDATIRAAAPLAGSRAEPTGRRITIQNEDIREKMRVHRISMATVFLVDASGSMEAERRMQSAKGAVFSMLQDSYRRRDRVGIVAFRDSGAEVVLPMSSKIDHNVEILADLVSGGRTPIPAALVEGLRILEVEKHRNRNARTMMVLISDGRANVALGRLGAVDDELIRLTNEGWREGIHMVFIDVEQDSEQVARYGSYKRILAERMAYHRVEDLTSSAIAAIVEHEKRIMAAKSE